MPTPILATKLYSPPDRLDLISRDQLDTRFENGLRCKLTLVSAPAGFGKTTAVSNWLRQYNRQAAWLALEEGDSDSVRFWRYLIAALQTRQPDLGQSAAVLLQAPQPPPIENLLTDLLNEIAATSSQIILVLDDYHLLESQDIHQGIRFLLDHLPRQLHLVIISREDPPLPLVRLRVQGQINEVRIDELRFSADAARQFLNRTMGLALQPDAVEALVRRTEGWVAGLQLAALSLQGISDPTDFIRAFAGDDRYVVDYLIDEVVQRQPQPIQEFLLQTAILRRLSAPLCNAVTKQANSRAILAQLEQANLFLLALDRRREWYRYHRLFGDLLRLRLQEAYADEDLQELHRRAADWHVQHNLVDDAVHHYLAAAEFVTAAELIEASGINQIVRGGLRTVLNWLALFPTDFLRTRPLLCVCQAWALNVTGQSGDVEQYLVDAAQALPNAPQDQQREIRGLISTIRAYRARRHNDVALSMQLLRQALTDLSSDNLIIRSTVNLNLGFNYSIIGELDLADQALASAVTEGQRCHAVYVTLIAMAIRANIYVAQGKLHQAAWLYQEAIEHGLAQNSDRPFPPAGYAYAGYGQLLYEWNDMVGAEAHLNQAVACDELMGDWSMTRRGLLPLAWLKQMQGDSGQAHALWQRALKVVQQAESERVEAQLMTHRARLWLAQISSVEHPSSGDEAALAAANEWATNYLRSNPNPHSYQEALAHCTLAWLDLVNGQASNALARLKPVARAANTAGQIDNLIKVLALQALAHGVSGDLETALAKLTHACDLAAPEGYIRTFVDFGLSMHALLQRVAASGIAPDYVAKLLSAFTDESVPTNVAPLQSTRHNPQAEIQNFIEPLKDREQQILRLMATDLTNQQIADELHLSLNTVKWHARNIYGKLGVSRRAQALRRAHELAIL